MPGEIVLKCAECGLTTGFMAVKYEGKRLCLNHKLDCSQQDLATPRLYLTQAKNPSEQ
jgi:hypothetical protein